MKSTSNRFHRFTKLIRVTVYAVSRAKKIGKGLQEIEVLLQSIIKDLNYLKDVASKAGVHPGVIASSANLSPPESLDEAVKTLMTQYYTLCDLHIGLPSSADEGVDVELERHLLDLVVRLMDRCKIVKADAVATSASVLQSISPSPSTPIERPSRQIYRNTAQAEAEDILDDIFGFRGLLPLQVPMYSHSASSSIHSRARTPLPD